MADWNFNLLGHKDKDYIPDIMELLRGGLILVVVWTTSACAPASITPTSAGGAPAPARACAPTLDDGVSPSYKPGAPVRSVVGQGHVVTGVVLSSVDCGPIPNAKLEFWPEEAGLGHPDSSRATFYTDENGRYRFECNPPEHIHMRISTPGYRTIGVNGYHPGGAAEETFEIVLAPE